MYVIPSTLHRNLNFIYNNEMYTLEADKNLQMEIKSQFSTISSILSPIQKNTPPLIKDTLDEY